MLLDTDRLFAQAEQVAADETARIESSAISAITFYWGGEYYGLPLADVREVAKVGPIAPLPGLPPTLLGAMNLHGEVIAVADLRPVLGLDPIPPTPTARLIIVTQHAERVGLIVDAIGDIFELPALDRDAATPDLILGRTLLANGRLLNLIDLPRALTTLAEG